MADSDSPEQMAVIAAEDNTAVVAIPGSGKTRVISKKIARIAAMGMTVLAVSFTKKAARELEERSIKALNEQQAKLCKVGTFHSATIRALMALPDSPIREMKLIKETTALLYKTRALEHVGLRATSFLAAFESARSKVTDRFGIDEATRLPKTDKTRADRLSEAFRLQKAVAWYEESLAYHNKFDFAGVMLTALRLAQAGVRIFNFDYILVDEFQDVDEVQLRLVIAHQPYSTLLVVGDDDQSVYAFRNGLGYRAFQIFRLETGARELKLTRNYRCRQEILDWADAVISENKTRVPKKLVANNGTGGQLQVVCCDDELAEHRFVINFIEAHLHSGAADVGVLARNNDLVRYLEAHVAGRFTYEVAEGESIWEQREAAAAISLLRAILRPAAARMGFEQALLWAGASARDAEVFRQAVTRTSVIDALDSALGRRDTPEQARAAARFLLDVLTRNHFPRAHAGPQDERELVSNVFLGLRLHVETCQRPSDSARSTQHRLLEVAEQALLEMQGTLAQRLAAIDHLVRRQERAKVSLITLHASKGREFDAVIIFHTTDDLMPGDVDTLAELEEERRLIYVGMTRARYRLAITYPASEIRYRRPQRLKLTRLLSVEGTPREEFDDLTGYALRLARRPM